MMKRLKTTDLTLIGLCTACICILAPIAIPTPFSPVPVTFGFFAVVLIGAVLGSFKGLLCILVYLFIGMAGVPVFSNYGSGLSQVFGPTGGYLLGYLFLVWCVGFAAEHFIRKIRAYLIGAAVGAGLCYLFGTLWLSLQLDVTWKAAFAMGVLPFIFVDLIKISMAVCLAYQIKIRLSMLGPAA